jgi:pimeloyl-ACP methyl ester carboxylesterase
MIKDNREEEKMKRAFVDLKEGQLHYRIEGEGEPVILLHMAVASSDEFVRPMHILSRSYKAIAPDLFGAGDSDPSPYPYKIMDHARTVINFMDALGIKKANIVGHHLGSSVGMEIQIGWPQRVNKLVLSGFGYFPEPGEGVPFKEPQNFTSAVEIKPDGSHLMEWWRRAGIWGGPPDILEERVLEYIKAGPKGEESHHATEGYNTKARLPLVTSPLMILFQTEDPFYCVAEGVKKLAPKGTKFTTIQNGHIYVDRIQPEKFAGAIIDFLGSPEKPKEK